MLTVTPNYCGTTSLKVNPNVVCTGENLGFKGQDVGLWHLAYIDLIANLLSSVVDH